MYILRGNELSIPEKIIANTTVDEVKNVLNELFSMSFLAVDPQNRDGFSSRPSYRDFMAFLFQPQNIVANADVMFYKADTMEHRQRLINIFPYALGAVTPEILAARQELERVKKQRDRLQRELDAIKEVSENWKQEISSWLMQAKEMGLIDGIDKATTFEEQVDLLSQVVDFVDCYFFGLFGMERWPTFNFADAAVVVCGIIFLITFVFQVKSDRKNNKKE